jgi:hypothetical protein
MWLNAPTSRTVMSDKMGQLMTKRSPWLIRRKIDQSTIQIDP